MCEGIWELHRMGCVLTNVSFKQFGDTTIGVASRGVRLDLHEFISTLRSRYWETQAVLYPIVQILNSFGAAHNFYAQQLRESAKRYDEADNDLKEELAVKEGKKLAKHAKMWGRVLTTRTRMCRESVAQILGGLVAWGEQRDKISQDISKSESEQERLQPTIQGITYVVDNFKQLRDFIGSSNEFWSSMSTNAMMLQDMDSATAKMLGEEVLNSASFEGSYQTTQELTKAAQKYLVMLDKQGFHMPEDPED